MSNLFAVLVSIAVAVNRYMGQHQDSDCFRGVAGC